ncbi:glycosyl hydrolase 115 family protein [Vibrio sp. WXL103]|uniref:glycosyl hydrolase 115 family protein n=1 Tax=Vibrio sp. WXL103 TaxID=3450710 RepID=UPI003EC66C8D
MGFQYQRGVIRAFIVSMFMLIVSGCSQEPESNEFWLATGDTLAEIYVSQDEDAKIVRAANDLAMDIERVTGRKPNIINAIDKSSNNVIIIGKLESPEIVNLKSQGAIDEIDGAEDLVESFLLKTITLTQQDDKNALVVAGSDAMGTIFGIYDISERIGVSPLYWWGDVVPEQQQEIAFKDLVVAPQAPSVRFRGIFINDEGAMTQWSGNTSIDKLHGNPSPEVYERVFELLLRMKANTLWPAMHGISNYFFEAKDDHGIAINPHLATEYGIYIGASHCENMGRNNLSEWWGWAAANKDKYDAEGLPIWDYSVNPLAIEAYWMERLVEAKDFNMIYTLGMRGVHDSPFKHENLINPTLADKSALLQKIIDRQREMIAEVFGAEDAVPQIFVPYEEVGELYNGESTNGEETSQGVDIPQDVIIVMTEDNFGYVRQTPRPHEQERVAGNGLYYHLAYQGYPTQYNWLYTTPLPLVQKELLKSYASNTNALWMINVGDIKPAELGIQFIMKMAYDINAYPVNATKTFLEDAAKQHLNIEGEQASEFADIITEFHQLAWPKKPEAMTPHWVWHWENDDMYQHYDTFVFGDEAQRQIENMRELESRAKAIYDDLDQASQAPFWHFAYYPIRSTRLMMEKTTYYRKNYQYAEQGRYASVNAYKELSEQAEAAIQRDLTFYNKEFMDGKWDGIMDPYADYNSKRNIFNVAVMPNTLIYAEKFIEDAVEGIGSVSEGQVTGDEQVTLNFSSFEDNKRFIDVFNLGLEPMAWQIETDTDWISVSQSSGEVDIEQRLWVTIDWDLVDAGTYQGSIKVTGAHGHEKSYPVKAEKYAIELEPDSYVESNGLVAIEAERYSDSAAGKDDSRWLEHKHFGYTGSSMVVKADAKVTDNHISDSARLDYKVLFTSKGTFYGELYRIPTLNEGKEMTADIMIGVNGEQLQTLSGVRQKGQKRNETLGSGEKVSWTWYRNVLAQMEKIPFEITIDEPGYHTISLYQVDAGIGIDRIVLATQDVSKYEQTRSLVGAPESYNNIAPWSPVAIAPTPEFSLETVTVNAGTAVEPMSDLKINFAMYGMPPALGFTPVSQRNVFNDGKSQLGWAKANMHDIKIEHNESTWQIPFWQRNGLTGKESASFFAKLIPGRYKVTYYMGDVRTNRNSVYRTGNDYQMSFTINGELLMDNEMVQAGNQVVKTVDVVVSDDELLELNLSGNWIINALEVVPIDG